MILSKIERAHESGSRVVIDAPREDRLEELEIENARLQKLVAELLIKNHELRELLRGLI